MLERGTATTGFYVGAVAELEASHQFQNGWTITPSRDDSHEPDSLGILGDGPDGIACMRAKREDLPHGNVRGGVHLARTIRPRHNFRLRACPPLLCLLVLRRGRKSGIAGSSPDRSRGAAPHTDSAPRG